MTRIRDFIIAYRRTIALDLPVYICHLVNTCYESTVHLLVTRRSTSYSMNGWICCSDGI